MISRCVISKYKTKLKTWVEIIHLPLHNRGYKLYYDQKTANAEKFKEKNVKYNFENFNRHTWFKWELHFFGDGTNRLLAGD